MPTIEATILVYAQQNTLDKSQYINSPPWLDHLFEDGKPCYTWVYYLPT